MKEMLVMALAHRIIPSLLVNGRQLIKGSRYEAGRSIGVPTQAVKVHQMRQVDELVLLDITATREKRGPDLDLINELASVCFSPLTVGGGVRSTDDVRELLRNGADKVCVGTGAMLPGLLSDIADRFGSSTLVASIDVRDTDKSWRVYTECGTSGHLIHPVDFAVQCEAQGAGEILLNAIDREGLMEGYDIDLIREVSREVSIPVIASCGCSGFEDMCTAIDVGADAVSAGALFQFTSSTPREAAEYLHTQGVEVRCS